MGDYTQLLSLDKKKVTHPNTTDKLNDNKANSGLSEEKPQKDISQKPGIMKPRDHGSTIPRYRDTSIPSNRDTTVSRNLGITTPPTKADALESIRRAVRQIGKEAATQRLTLEEKKALKAIEYTYDQQGITTTGNEIMRIATNYILWEYREYGENSILARVLTLLHS